MIDKIMPLWEQKLSNRKIAKLLGITHNTVAQHLGKAGLKSHTYNQKIQYSENGAICTKCGIEKALDEFQHGRKGQNYEYRFSYCKSCRVKQTRLNINNDLNKYLKDRFRYLRDRAYKTDIVFDLDVDYILMLYNYQKGLCVYTQNRLECRYGQGVTANSLSFDKIVPEKGYVKGNVLLCSYRANLIKSDQTIEELELWMPLWFNRLQEFREGLPLFRLGDPDGNDF